MTVIRTILEKGELSRIELAHETQLSPSTVSALVGELLEEGILAESGQRAITCLLYTSCFLMLFSSNQMLFKPLYAFFFTDHDEDIIHRKNMSGIDVSHRLFAARNGYDV